MSEKFEIDKQTIYFLSGYIFGLAQSVTKQEIKYGLEKIERTLTKACDIESCFDADKEK